MKSSHPTGSSPHSLPFEEYRVKHTTTYNYSYPVSLSYHNLHLEPKNWPVLQKVKDFNIQISPAPTDLRSGNDFFGNSVHSFSIQEPYQTLEVETTFSAQIISNPPPVEDMSINCDQVRKALHGNTSFQNLQALQYIYPSPLIPNSVAIEKWAARFFDGKRPFMEAVLELSKTLKEEIEFDPNATKITTSVEEFFTKKRGVCQDFSQLMISCLRAHDLPARYISGYILTHPREGEKRLEGADASHAWVSVFVPGYGWVDIDPTNDLVVSDQHIRVAIGRDFKDVSLLKGSIIGGGKAELDVAVTVWPISEPIDPNQQQQQQQQQ